MILLRTFEGMLPMQLGVSREVELFLISCLIGAALGLCYQALRALRLIIPHFKAAVFTEDLLFGLFCGLCYFLLFSMYSLKMRGFIAFGMALSALLVSLLIGEPLIRLLRLLRDKLAGHIAKKVTKIRRKFV